jgi:hypothetical protein
VPASPGFVASVAGVAAAAISPDPGPRVPHVSQSASLS